MRLLGACLESLAVEQGPALAILFAHQSGWPRSRLSRWRRDHAVNRRGEALGGGQQRGCVSGQPATAATTRSSGAGSEWRMSQKRKAALSTLRRGEARRVRTIRLLIACRCDVSRAVKG